MAIVTINQLSIAFRGPPLLDGVTCHIEPGQRIGLLGRNGSGKTTLLRILSGQIEPDDGQVVLAPETKVSLLPQDVPRYFEGTVFDVVASGTANNEQNNDESWRAEQPVVQILSRMGLDGDAQVNLLSSGMKRRVLLARTLVSAPDLLLLDEPTNHLDVDAITWLEGFLDRWNATLVFVTHDRMFLGKMATRILEIDRGRLFDWSCDYATFLQRKEVALAAEERQDALFDKKLVREEVWIRQGIKARRTRNEGRVRALQQMRQVRGKRQAAHGRVRMAIDEGTRSGRLVVEVDGISFAYGDRPIVHDFSTTILRGDKVGIIGHNGTGKTTLLRLLLGQLPPQRGTIRLGTRLQTAYFDQLREQLNEDETVQENVGHGYDSVRIGGEPRHIIGYLRDFLFTPERANTPVRFLSGGERNRVLLAQLFAKPANVIILDEPTNDLDTETLELLEDQLVAFQGTVLLVSHDRTFLNNVVTSTIVFEEGNVKEYVGGYDDWLRTRQERLDTMAAANERKASPPRGRKYNSKSPPSKTDGTDRPRRLTYREQQELATLPVKIEHLEAEIETLHQVMAEADFYQQPGAEIANARMCLKNLDCQLAESYERWEVLENHAD